MLNKIFKRKLKTKEAPDIAINVAWNNMLGLSPSEYVEINNLTSKQACQIQNLLKNNPDIKQMKFIEQKYSRKTIIHNIIRLFKQLVK